MIVNGIDYCDDRYDCLYVPEDFRDLLNRDPAKLVTHFNGVGPGKLVEYIPQTVWGMDLTPVSDIHDWMYVVPTYFESEAAALKWKEHSDRVFLNNGLRLADRRAAEGGWWDRIAQGLRKSRVYKYYQLLDAFGGPSFWEGKERHIKRTERMNP